MPTWRIGLKAHYHVKDGCGGELDDIIDANGSITARFCRRCGESFPIIQEASLRYTTEWVRDPVKAAVILDGETLDREQQIAHVRNNILEDRDPPR